MLKPQDVVISIKLLQDRKGGAAPTYSELASALKMSPSEAHAGVHRSLDVGLLRRPTGSTQRMPIPVRRALEEFLISGLKYVWPTRPGAIGRGMPTCSSFSPVARELDVPEPETPFVWRNPAGTVRGEIILPLYPKVPEVCADDAWMHEWLALVDVLRCKTGREASLAANAIRNRLA